jgi:hypothetical protein
LLGFDDFFGAGSTRPARIRAWNLLYVARGLADEPPFSEPRRVSLDELWQWNGKPWGGAVPEDTE